MSWIEIPALGNLSDFWGLVLCIGVVLVVIGIPVGICWLRRTKRVGPLD